MEIIDFDWDSHNVQKNKIKHGVEPFECEEVFVNDPIIKSAKKIRGEMRKIAFGSTFDGRLLTMVYTRKNKKIRVISCRDMTALEKKAYRRLKK